MPLFFKVFLVKETFMFIAGRKAPLANGDKTPSFTFLNGNILEVVLHFSPVVLNPGKEAIKTELMIA